MLAGTLITLFSDSFFFRSLSIAPAGGRRKLLVRYYDTRQDNY